ncbi:MAG: nitrilotriacetate monooxygenase [Rhodospirillaceae bacterium]|nr:nitrilotriacetate monooxygenase [Rhodospirillaceae bacterium]|tara:strand:- start:1881 stop:2381 length:501 start_codon:yes stop_codon:yes gene_type:complete
MPDAPFDSREFRNALGNFATGVTIVTAKGETGEMVGVTASSFNSVSLEPPLILWSLDRTSASLQTIEAASHFCVHILSDAQADECMAFAKSGGDKFSELDCGEGLGGAPLLDGCLARFECRNMVHHDGGDHVIIVGEVERFQACDGDPLLFFRGKLSGIAPVDDAT